jgi:hypothetical protein
VTAPLGPRMAKSIDSLRRESEDESESEIFSQEASPSLEADFLYEIGRSEGSEFLVAVADASRVPARTRGPSRDPCDGSRDMHLNRRPSQVAARNPKFSASAGLPIFRSSCKKISASGRILDSRAPRVLNVGTARDGGRAALTTASLANAGARLSLLRARMRPRTARAPKRRWATVPERDELRGLRRDGVRQRAGASRA